MRLPLWKAQQFQDNKPRTSNVLLRVSNIAKLIYYPFSYFFLHYSTLHSRYLKVHSHFWNRADMDTSFLSLKKVHPNLKSKYI